MRFSYQKKKIVRKHKLPRVQNSARKPGLKKASTLEVMYNAKTRATLKDDDSDRVGIK